MNGSCARSSQVAMYAGYGVYRGAGRNLVVMPCRVNERPTSRPFLPARAFPHLLGDMCAACLLTCSCGGASHSLLPGQSVSHTQWSVTPVDLLCVGCMLLRKGGVGQHVGPAAMLFCEPPGICWWLPGAPLSRPMLFPEN